MRELEEGDQPRLSDFVLSYREEDGTEHVWLNEEKALAYLLIKGVLHINTRPYVENPWDPREQWEFGAPTTLLFVNCNDIFAWASADSEPIEAYDQISEGTRNELYDLLRFHLESPQWGYIKWCALKRNQQPQSPVVKDMIKAGVWDDRLRDLPHNPTDDCCDWHRRTAEENQSGQG